MQQNIVTAFLTALFAMVLSVLTALGQTNPPCVAPPPPANLTVTGVSTNSISLSWALSGPYNPSYRIDVKDITAGGFMYPPLYTNALQYTVGGLLPGHLHEFKVYAYYYLSCPLSSPAIINQATATFIVEDIVSYQSQRCQPSILVHKDASSPSLHHCIDPFDPSYQKDYVGKVKAPGAAEDLTFRIIFLPTNANGVQEVRIAPVGYIPPRYHLPPCPVSCFSATCSYTNDNGKTVTLLTVGVGFSPQAQQADVAITFGSSCDYAYCGDACAPNKPGKIPLADRADSGGSEQMQEVLERPTTLPSPNPFTESTTLQYELASPTLVSIQLYNAVGHLVQTVQSATQLPAGEYTATVDGRMLPKGAYFIVVQKGDQRQLFTLVKQD